MVPGLHTRERESRREDFAALGLALCTMRRFEEALAAYDDGLRLEPDDAELHNGRGVALLELRRPAEARDEFLRALAAVPDCLDALGNLGNALFKLNRPEEALTVYDRVLNIVPDNAQLLTNRAIALRRLERPHEALMSAARAIAAQPNFAPARFVDAGVRLYLGDFAGGWRGYEWRRGGAFTPQRRKLAAPLWLGEQSLAGKTILLHAEQGFGDTIQFVRYAPLVAARGAHVIVEVQPALVRLVSAMPGIATVLGRGAQLPPFDFHCPLPSLPLACGTALETIPASLPYLAPPQDRVGYWRARLPRCRPVIGLVWAGERAHDNDINRSMRLEALAPLLDLVDVRFVSLQHDVCETDAPLLAQRTDIVSIGQQFTDFADTAAAIAALDLVIAVDTAVAHLTGALGKPLLLLLPFAADFRWLRQRSDSPWYPTARLFRQPCFGDWASVAEAVREEAKRFVCADTTSSSLRGAPQGRRSNPEPVQPPLDCFASLAMTS